MKPTPKKPTKRKAIPCWTVQGKPQVSDEWYSFFSRRHFAERFRQIYGGTVHRGRFVFDEVKK